MFLKSAILLVIFASVITLCVADEPALMAVSSLNRDAGTFALHRRGIPYVWSWQDLNDQPGVIWGADELVTSVSDVTDQQGWG